MKLMKWMQTNGEFGAKLYKQFTGIKDNGEKVELDSLTHGTRVKLLWKCDVCQHEWYARLDTRIYNKTNCPKCKCIERNKVGKKHNKITLIDWCKNNGEYGNTILKQWTGVDDMGYELDINSISYASNKYAEFKCNKGHIWIAQIMNRTANHTGCPICNKLKFNKSLLDWSKENGDIGETILNQFKINNIPPETISYKSGVNYNFLCEKCGKIWNTKLVHRTVYGTGCPMCNRSSTSFGEQIIYRYYNNIFENVKNRIKTVNGYEFDVVIFDLNACIEYNGEKWHSDENTIKRDKEKRELCNKHNITLITVWQSTKVNTKEDSNIYITDPKNYNQVAYMISCINEKLGIDKSVNNEVLKKAMNEAYKYMHDIDI